MFRRWGSFVGFVSFVFLATPASSLAAPIQFVRSNAIQGMMQKLETDERAVIEAVEVLSQEKATDRVNADLNSPGNKARAKVKEIYEPGLERIVDILKELRNHYARVEQEIRGLVIPKRFAGNSYWEAYFKKKSEIYSDIKSDEAFDVFQKISDSISFANNLQKPNLLMHPMRVANWEGKPESALELLGICTLQVRLYQSQLWLNHARALSEGDKSISLLRYTDIRNRIQSATQECRAQFPQLPDFLQAKLTMPMEMRDKLQVSAVQRKRTRMAAMRRVPVDQIKESEVKVELRDILDESQFWGPDQKGLSELPIAQFFYDAQGRISNSNREQLMGLLQVHLSAATALYSYVSTFFPQKGNEDFLQALAVGVHGIPGAGECVTLAGGYSHFDGPPCQIKPFKVALDNFIEGYERLAGSSAIPLVLSEITDFKLRIEESPAGENLAKELPPKTWADFKADLDDKFANQTFNDGIKEAWKAKIGPGLFADTRKLHNLIFNTSIGEPKHTQKTSDMLYKHVVKAFQDARFSPVQNNDVIDLLVERRGFENNYEDVVGAARIVRQKFHDRVLKIVGEEAKIERLTVEGACIRKDRPTVLVATGVVPHDPKLPPDVARYRGPGGFHRYGFAQLADVYADSSKAENLATVPQKALRDQKVKATDLIDPFQGTTAGNLANLYANIQGNPSINLGNWKRAMQLEPTVVAGLGARTAIVMMLQTVVQSRMLHRYEYPKYDSLASLGIKETNNDPIRRAQETKPFLPWKDLMHLGVDSYFQMVEGHAAKMADDAFREAKEKAQKANPAADDDELDAIAVEERDKFLAEYKKSAEAYKTPTSDLILLDEKATLERLEKTGAFFKVMDSYKQAFKQRLIDRAEQLRKLHELKKNLFEDSVNKAPSVAYALNMPPEFFNHVPVDAKDPKKFQQEFLNQRQLNAALFGRVRTKLLQDYLVFIDGKWAPTKKDKQNWESGIPKDARTYEKDINDAEQRFTIDEFLKLLALHAGGGRNDRGLPTAGQLLRNQIKWDQNKLLPWTREVFGVTDNDIPGNEDQYFERERGMGTLPSHRTQGKNQWHRGDNDAYLPVAIVWDFAHFLMRHHVMIYGVVNHMREFYGNRIQYVDLAIRYALYDAPMLGLNQAWKTYDGSQYNFVMGAFERNAVDEINTLFSYTDATALLKRLMPNIVLWNAVLRMYPDISGSMCDAMDEIKKWADIKQGAEMGAIAACMVLALIPPLTPVALVAAVGVGATLLLDSAYETFVVKHGQLNHIEGLTHGGAAALGMDEYELGVYRQMELRSQYTTAVVIFAIEVAMVAVPVAKKLPKLEQGIGKLWDGYWKSRALVKKEIEAAAARDTTLRARIWERFWKRRLEAKIPEHLRKHRGEVKDVIELVAKYGGWMKKYFEYSIFAPLKLVGLVERETNTLLRLLFDKSGAMRAWGAISKRGVADWARGALMNLPWSPFGLRWQTGAVGNTANALMFGGALFGLNYQAKQMAELPMLLQLDNLQLNPDRYRPLHELVMKGKLSSTEMLRLIELDDEARADYQVEFNKLRKEYLDSMDEKERGEFLSAMQAARNAYEVRLKELMRQNGYDTNEYLNATAGLRHMDQAIRGLKVTPFKKQ